MSAPRLLPVALGLALALGADAPAAAENTFTVDLFAFSQDDHGGQPLRAEGMHYGSLRLATDLQLSDTLGLTLNAAGGLIDNEDPRPLPPTVDQVLSTQASAQIITLDAQASLRYRPLRAPWGLAAGLYYHHQRRSVFIGADVTGSLDLAGGDSVLALTYSFRFGIRKPRRWDDLVMDFDYLRSHNLIFGWTQNLSPAWLIATTIQYTRQDGPLDDQYNFVVLYDDGGAPVHLGFESLPRERNRAQISLRTRFSPTPGLSLGLDTSVYRDDWGVSHGAIEPSLEVPLSTLTRVRLWYRFAAQSQAKYFRSHPTTVARYQTQDSDLGAFTVQSPGMLLLFPLATATDPRWMGRLAVFGFFRSDGISAGGANLGVEALW